MPERFAESRSPHSGPQRHGVRRHDDKGIETTAHWTVSQPEPHGEVACCARNADPAATCSACHALCRHHKFDHSTWTDSNGNDDDHDCGDTDVVNVHHHDIFDNNFHNDDIFDHDNCDNDDVDRGLAVLWSES